MNDIDYFTLKSTQSYLGDKKTSEILEVDKAVERAKERVLRSIHSSTTGFSLTDEYDEESFSTYPGKEIEASSIPIARIIISLIDDSRIINNYTKAEANTIIERVKQRDNKNLFELSQKLGLNIEKNKESEIINETFTNQILKDNFDKKPTEKYNEILNEKQGSEIEIYKIPLFEYVKYSHKSSELSLPNRNFIQGKTFMNDIENFLKQVIIMNVRKDLPYDVNDEIAEKLEPIVQEIEENIPEDYYEYEIDRVEEELMPPVIKKLLNETRKGKNLDHMYRFTLASFLINIGMSTDEIVEFFGINDIENEEAQAFIEEKTRYQVNHIKEDGLGEEYVTPSYDKIEALGIKWNKDSLEKKVNHPLTYYKIKLRENDEYED